LSRDGTARRRARGPLTAAAGSLTSGSMGRPDFTTLAEASGWYADWLAAAALPLWASAGVDPGTGAFHEALSVEGRPVAGPRRARVQARQAFVFASAAPLDAGWAAVATRGYGFYRAHYRRDDGLFAVLADAAGRVLDDTPRLYEQAFSLLAMEALAQIGTDTRADAEALLGGLQALRHPAGGFRELTEHPFQANAHMHLLEATLAWEARGGAAWRALSDEIVALAMTRFIDADGGFLREFFDADWRPAPGDDGRRVEPGHQFEWAWLLERWGVARGDAAARTAARTLVQRGLAGVDRQRGVAVNALTDDLRVSDPSARLWPQTEYLKAALIVGEEADALTAANGLARYLDTPARGAWRDKLRPGGRFVEEPAPASSFYHLMVAIEALKAWGQSGPPPVRQ